MKILQLLILSLLLQTSLFAQAENFSVAQKESASTDKPILMVFSGSDWCKPCILLKKEVLSHPKFEAFAEEKVVLLEVDFPYRKANRLSKEKQAANDELAARFNPEGNFPKVLLMNANGKELGIINARELSTFMLQAENLLTTKI